MREKGRRTPSPVSRSGIRAVSSSRRVTVRTPSAPWKRAVGLVRRTSTLRSLPVSGRLQPWASRTLSASEGKRTSGSASARRTCSSAREGRRTERECELAALLSDMLGDFDLERVGRLGDALDRLRRLPDDRVLDVPRRRALQECTHAGSVTATMMRRRERISRRGRVSERRTCSSISTWTVSPSQLCTVLPSLAFLHLASPTSATSWRYTCALAPPSGRSTTPW